MLEIVQESVKVCTTGMSTAEPFERSILRCEFITSTSTSLYSGINTLFAQNPVFEIVHDESVKVYPHIELHVQRGCSAEPSMRRILCH